MRRNYHYDFEKLSAFEMIALFESFDIEDQIEIVKLTMVTYMVITKVDLDQEIC